MTQIFVSYRSQDYENLVKPVVNYLRQTFGDEFVILDRTHLAPGADWLAQLRSCVAMCDAVLVCVSPTWTKLSPRDGVAVDYVVEEVTLAKKLGRPIIPLIFDLPQSSVNLILPPELLWLQTIQSITLGGSDIVHANIVAKALRNLGISSASNDALAFQRHSALSALTELFSATLRPVSVAAKSLHPAKQRLVISLYKVAIALGAMTIANVALTSTFNPIEVARYAGALGLVASVIAVLGLLLTAFAARPPPPRSVIGFSLHTASLLFLVFSIWVTAFRAWIPEELNLRIARITRQPTLEPDKLVTLFDSLSPATFAVITAIQFLAVLHCIYVLRGSFLAGVIILGWRRWLSATIFAVGLLIFLMLWTILSALSYIWLNPR